MALDDQTWGLLDAEDLLRQTRRDMGELIARLDHLVDEQPDQAVLTNKRADLDGLIDRVVDNFGPDEIGRRISHLPKASRPCAILGSNRPPYSNDPYDDRLLIATALRYMFLILTPRKAIIESCGMSEEQAKELLEAFQIPSPVDLEIPFCNASEAVRRICCLEDEVNERLEQGYVDTAYLEEQTLRAWALAEGSLRLALAFFTLHFETKLPPEFVQRLRMSVSKKASDEIVVLFREMEEMFQYGELLSERAKRERSISSIDDDLAKRIQIEQSKRIKEQREREANNLRDECQRYFGRESPFKGIILDYYNEWKGGNGGDLARYSLRKARELVQALRDNRIVPQLVVIMGRGRDWYGNSLAWFSEIENILSDSLPHREKVEWMYSDPTSDFGPFQQVALLVASADPREPLIEPVVYPIEKILGLLEAEGQLIDDTEVRAIGADSLEEEKRRRTPTQIRKIL
jgi:hypothetical protein